MTENWYIVLELEFDPNPVNDEAVIADRIEEKRKFWAKKANDPFKGNEYKKYLEKISNIKDDMIGEANIRAELIKDACEKTYGPIDKTLKMIKKTEIAQDTIDKIASKQKVDVEVVKRRASALGIKIVAAKSGDYQATYDKYYKTKPQNADKFKQMDSHMENLGVANLYDFLYTGTNIKNPQNLPCDALKQRAKEKKTKEYNKHDSISSSGQKLCGHCDECFKDDSSKQIYDKYLEFNKRKAILDEVKNSYDLVGEITPESYSDFVGQLTEIFKNRKDAEGLLIAFCKIEKIPVPTTGGDSSKTNPNIKVCRCGCINDVSDGRKVCKACGLELQIKCPKCGTVNDANINVCKCGFKFENIDKAVSLCELASDALETMDFPVAEAHLADADKYWPGSDKVSELRSRLQELKNRVGEAVNLMRKARDEKKYYEARKQLESIKKFAPSYSEPVLESEIADAIDTAEKYKKTAQSAKNESDIVDACTKAYEACNDCPGVREIISKYPPAAPTEFVIATDPSAKVNVLTWKKSTTPGLLYYSVVRKEGAIPISVQDGFLVGRVSMCSINDRDIKPGVQYFYAIFAERAGVYSRALTYKDAVSNLFEISNVKAAAGDGLIQLTWDPIADNASVEIEQTDPSGKKTKLVCNSRNNFVDKGLTNDQEYRYRVFLTYAIGAQKLSTKGISLSGTPTRPPLPIEKLIVKPAQGNEFQIEWENPEKGEVQFFCSTKKPEWLSGDLVPISDIEAHMNGLVVNKTSINQGTFKYEGEELIYVLAVVAKSGSAVIGTIARASKGGAVKINSVSLVNGKIMITLDLPKDYTGFVVLYRHDQFPNDISDVNTTRKYIPLKQYKYDGGLVIDSNEPENYYFSVFAEFKRDGESDYSTGTDYLFSNVAKQTITYSIHVNKKLFGGGTINISFESDNKKYMLPDIDIISAQDRAPMFKKTGKLFYQIPSQEANGNVEVTIPLEKGMARETYIKPFLKDENLASRYVLKIKLGSDHKIS